MVELVLNPEAIFMWTTILPYSARPRLTTCGHLQDFATGIVERVQPFPWAASLFSYAKGVGQGLSLPQGGDLTLLIYHRFVPRGPTSSTTHIFPRRGC
jgi:threonine/homoserine/homoserine lactone efflux protein